MLELSSAFLRKYIEEPKSKVPFGALQNDGISYFWTIYFSPSDGII